MNLQRLKTALCLVLMFWGLFGGLSVIAAESAKPQKPRDLIAAPSNKALELSWSAPQGEKPVAYHVYVDGEFYKKVKATELKVENLKNGADYAIAVTAVDAAGLESDKVTVTESPANVLPLLIVIFLCIAYIYNKVFRVEQLTFRQSISKHVRALRNRQFKIAGRSVLIYGLILIGSYMLLFFQLMGLPIIISLAVAIGLMLIVRIRYWIQGRQSGPGESQ
jgi:hypothetical protein